MSTHWLVGPLVGWLLAGWSDGPLVRPPCRGYRSDAANLGWFNSQLPLQSLWLKQRRMQMVIEAEGGATK